MNLNLYTVLSMNNNSGIIEFLKDSITIDGLK